MITVLLAGWGIVGWLVLVFIVAMIAVLAYIFARQKLLELRITLQRKVHARNCRRGDHGPDFLIDRNVHDWFDPANNRYIAEVHTFHKCKRCWTPIAGTNRVEARKETSKYDLQAFNKFPRGF